MAAAIVLGAVLGVGAGVVALVHGRTSPAPPVVSCDDRLVERAQVRIDLTFEVDGRDFPRVTSKLVARFPADQGRAEPLFENEDSRKAWLRCLLGEPGRRPAEWRDTEPLVTFSGREVVMTDTVWTDIARPGLAEVGVAAVAVHADRWEVTVRLPTIFRAADEVVVAMSAPGQVLELGTAWQVTKVGPDRVVWAWDQPRDSTAEWTARVIPEVRPRVAMWAAGTAEPVMSGLFWALALTLAVVTLYYVWRAGGRVRRAVFPLMPLIFVAGVFGSTSALQNRIVGRNDEVWAWIAWSSSVAFTLAIVVAAWLWWVPRVAVVSIAAVLAGLLGFGVFSAPGPHPYRTDNPEYLTPIVVVEASVSVLTTVLLFAGLGNAVRVLWGRTPPRRLPLRLWLVSSLFAVLLVAEQFGIEAMNVTRHQWLTPELDFTESLLTALWYHQWDLVDDSTWILLMLAPVAVLAAARDLEFIRPAEAKRLGIAMFLVGPAEWLIYAWNVPFPVWPLGWLVLILFVRLSWPVLARVPAKEAVAIRDDPGHVSSRAAAARVTTLDVALALGPGRTAVGNMAHAARFGVITAAFFGPPLLIYYWVTSQLISADQQDSLLLSFGQDIAWQVVKYASGGAALGLLWHHLPGARGPVKGACLAIAFAAVDGLWFLVPRLAGGFADSRGLVSIGLFALAMLTVGVLMDRAALKTYDLDIEGRWQGIVARYGLENTAARVTLFVTPLAAIVTIVTSLLGPTQDAPSVNPGPPRGQDQSTEKPR